MKSYLKQEDRQLWLKVSKLSQNEMLAISSNPTPALTECLGVFDKLATENRSSDNDFNDKTVFWMNWNVLKRIPEDKTQFASCSDLDRCYKQSCQTPFKVSEFLTRPQYDAIKSLSPFDNADYDQAIIFDNEIDLFSSVENKVKLTSIALQKPDIFGENGSSAMGIANDIKGLFENNPLFAQRDQEYKANDFDKYAAFASARFASLATGKVEVYGLSHRPLIEDPALVVNSFFWDIELPILRSNANVSDIELKLYEVDKSNNNEVSEKPAKTCDLNDKKQIEQLKFVRKKFHSLDKSDGFKPETFQPTTGSEGKARPEVRGKTLYNAINKFKANALRNKTKIAPNGISKSNNSRLRSSNSKVENTSSNRNTR